MSNQRNPIFAIFCLICVSSLSLASCAQADLSSSPTFSKTAIADPPKETQQPQETEEPQALVGSYIPIEVYETSTETYANTKVVLFFNAAWCSTCKAARDNFKASLNDIPGDLTIVVVDFDDSQELRSRYEVTLQHTFVQIDANGEVLKKWSGSRTIEDLVKQTA